MGGSYACVCYVQVYATELGDSGSDECLNTRLAGRIAADRYRTDFCSARLGGCNIEIVDDDANTIGCQARCNGAAYAATCAGDDGC